MTDETKPVAEESVAEPATKKPTRRTRKTKAKQVDVVDENIAAKPEDREIPAAGDIPEADTVIEPVDAPLESERGAYLAFMEERVQILLQDPQDHNPEPIVPVGVNGRVLYLQRGEVHELPRKYVEVLARARRTNYRTVEVTAADGSRTTVLRATQTLQYPFTVINDPNPKGAEWLKRIMNEAV